MVRTGDGLNTTPKATKGPLGREIIPTEEQVQGVKQTGCLNVSVTLPPHYVKSPLFGCTPARPRSSGGVDKISAEAVGD